MGTTVDPTAITSYVLKPGTQVPQESGIVYKGPEIGYPQLGIYTVPGLGQRPSHSNVSAVDGSQVSTGAYAYGGGTILPGDKPAGEVNRTGGDLYKNGVQHKYSMTYYA